MTRLSLFFLFGAKPETNLSPSTSLLPVKFCAKEPSQGFLSAFSESLAEQRYVKQSQLVTDYFSPHC